MRVHTQKRQVCDHCGGRFGLVTHRWWGNKFCKRMCRDNYVHEVALGRDPMRRWLWFASRARAAGTVRSVNRKWHSELPLTFACQAGRSTR